MHRAAERVDRAIRDFRKAAEDLTLEDCEGDEQLFHTISTSLRQAAALLELRFKYLKVAPWCFVNAESQDGAQRFLASATSRRFEEQDVLTQFLLRTYDDDLKVVAAGGDCSPKLRKEVQKMKETPLDESAGEGYHRSTHLTRIRARASTIAYVKMSTRIHQTNWLLKGLIKKGEAGKNVLRYEWLNWSRVLQTKRRSLWRKKHWSVKKVIERAYRMDEFSEEDWSSIAVTIPAPGQGPPPDCDKKREANHEMMGLRVEYMQDVLKTREWYRISVPVVTTNEEGVEEARTEDRHFQLLGQTSSKSRPHLMPTVDSWRDPVLRKQLALHIQETSVKEVAEPSADGSVLVFLDADPRWVSFEDIGPWKSVETTLTRFLSAKGTSDHPGCLRLAVPELARPVHPLTDLKCPTLCIINELKRLGWIFLRRTVTHKVDKVGPLDGREAVSMKAYYIVVLELARTLPLGGKNIPSNQPIAYYQLLLLGHAVAAGLGAPEYRRLLKGAAPVAPPPAVEDEEGFQFVLPRPKAKVHAIDMGPIDQPDPEDPRALIRAADEKEGKGRVVKSKSETTAAPPKKGSGKGAGKTKGKAPAVGPPVLGPPLPPPAAPAPLPEPPAPAFEFGVPAKAIRAPAKARSGRNVRRKFKPAIGGGGAFYDEFPNPDTGSVYKHWRFQCPHHDNCEKVWGVIPKNTRMHGFLEPIAYLHVWRDTPPGASGHRLTEADPDAVTRFFNEHQVELEALFNEFASP